MRNFIRMFMIVGLLLGCGSMARAQVSFGIRIGPPPRVRVEHRPPRPGPDFVWVTGYWYPDHGHYVWESGYWTRPPYPGAYWVPPHRADGEYFQGYWNGPHGRFYHNHAWDHDQQRDYDRYRDDHHDDHH
ncbi:MAG TPA: hypothetical protein VMB47_19775 [Candidatus Aquilonibacter sp.]|nr:hypothetical protein [Candidatus Aquilonibacter sp.]